METVQIVIDKTLLLAADAAARRTKRNRSALVRDALREHLQRLDVLEKEAREREGYRRMPQTEEEMHLWDGETVWPAE
ncbi:MAG TPA: ribbon-helix-helix protein, CopG family [Acidobacteriaceae bacterium]|jgi:metal-responsive CopG/Arc/MetJ family transcriptional regulator|nr:ribbon-helix-helix protein, CopG family [Acidobacteriaceae bacterium]